MNFGSKSTMLRKSFIAAALAGQIPVAHALCLNPFGCAPSNYDECVHEATTRPTDTGVKMAMRQCYERFKAPEEARRAAEEQKRAEAFAERWKKAIETYAKAPEIERYLGAPSSRSDAMTCSPLTASSTKPTFQCVTYYWNDSRLLRPNHRFRLEALTDSAGTVWAVWPDSL